MSFSIKDNEQSNLEKSYRKKWTLIKPALESIHPAGIASVIFGLMVMVGYVLGLESLYRPVHEGPASNPLTAVCIISLGLALMLYRPYHRSIWQKMTVILVAVLCSVRLLDSLLATNFSAVITPFQNIVEQELSLGKNNAMGSNTALMLLGFSISILLSIYHKFIASQIACFITFALPMLSFLGYLYEVEQFYGQMSLVTASLGVLLTIGIIPLQAHRGVVRALLSPYIGGRTARVQIILALTIPFLLGWLMVNSQLQIGNQFGFFVISITWFIVAIICFSALLQEKIDHKRRAAERNLSMLALYDPLTHLPNRRMFYDVARREIARSKRKQQSTWLLMVDIDHFKNINDTAGHAHGDLVLEQFSTVLTSSIRSMDLAARIGGEEFVVLLSETNIVGARRVAETIRYNVEHMFVDDWTELHGAITVSIGCADTMIYSSFTATLAAADRALYQAKQMGRNQVVVERLCESAELVAVAT